MCTDLCTVIIGVSNSVLTGKTIWRTISTTRKLEVLDIGHGNTKYRVPIQDREDREDRERQHGFNF